VVSDEGLSPEARTMIAEAGAELVLAPYVAPLEAETHTEAG
jgi:hypothetical protein